MAALRVGGGGMEQATLVLLELVKGWRILSWLPLVLPEPLRVDGGDGGSSHWW